MRPVALDSSRPQRTKQTSEDYFIHHYSSRCLFNRNGKHEGARCGEAESVCYGAPDEQLAVVADLPWSQKRQGIADGESAVSDLSADAGSPLFYGRRAVII